MQPSFLSILRCEDENQAESLGDLGNKTRDEVVSDVGNPALAWCTRLWCWCWPLLIRSETLDLGQGVQCRQQLSARGRLKQVGCYELL